MRLLQLFFISILCIGFLQAQDTSIESLKAMQAEKQAAADALAAEAADLQKQIDEFPGWKIGGVGVLGLDLNSNNNWFAIPQANSSSTAYGIGASAFANQDQEKYFWRNLLTANLKKTTTILDNNFDDDVPNNKVDATADVLEISSLAGYKLAPKWALSVEGRYTSTILNLNKPGKAVVSAGATWLPIPNAVVVIHPIGYEKNWPGDLVSTLGAKIGASYAAQIIPGVAWSTNLSAFIPYGGGDATLSQHPLKDANPRGAINADYDLGADAIAGSERVEAYSGGDLTNWTWMNTFSTNIFKGIGVGLNVGLRNDKQIANQAAYERATDLSTFSLDSVDDGIQMFYSLGLSYTL